MTKADSLKSQLKTSVKEAKDLIELLEKLKDELMSIAKAIENEKTKK